MARIKRLDALEKPVRKRMLFLNHRQAARLLPEERPAPRPRRSRHEYIPPLYRYSDGVDRVAYKMRLLGANETSIAEAIGCSTEQLTAWRHEHPSFAKAWNEGGELADAEIAKAFYRRAKGYSHPAERIFYDAKAGEVVRAEYIEHYPPDTAAAIRWLANRQPKLWREKMEVTGADGEPLRAPNIQIQLVAATTVER